MGPEHEHESQSDGALRTRVSRRTLLRLIGAAGAASALAGALTACGGGSSTPTPASGDGGTGASTPGASGQETATAEPGGKLTYGIWQNPDTLDPGASGLIATSKIAINLFDPLVFAAQDTPDDYYPALATTWEVNADATEFTFNLRDDVTFHDGTPFDA